MAYNTHYKLKADRPWQEDFAAYITKQTGDKQYMSFALESTGGTQEGCSWYYHEDDMRAMSLAFPGVRFTLSGEGEESCDVWEKHFRDGMMQECRAAVVIPPFDASKLK